MDTNDDLRKALGTTFTTNADHAGTEEWLEKRSAGVCVRVILTPADGTAVHVLAVHPTKGHLTELLYSCEFTTGTPIAVIVTMVEQAIRSARYDKQQRQATQVALV